MVLIDRPPVEDDELSPPEGRENASSDHLLRVLLVVCWALVLAKATFVVLSTKTPPAVEVAYVIALPTVLWNLRRGRELLGSFFYVGLLALVGIAASAWTLKVWLAFLDGDQESLRALGYTVGITILAINFMILLYFIGKELVLSAPERRPKVAFPEPPTHPSPTDAPSDPERSV